MVTYKRKYKKLVFFRKDNNDDELTRLSNENKDFEFRKLLKEEFDKDIHVAFSRKKIFEIFDICIFIFSIFVYKNTVLFNWLIGIGIVLLIIYLYFRYQFKRTIIKYKSAFHVVDHVMLQDHGISLPPYL